jgi:hypothetical protein
MTNGGLGLTCAVVVAEICTGTLACTSDFVNNHEALETNTEPITSGHNFESLSVIASLPVWTTQVAWVLLKSLAPVDN